VPRENSEFAVEILFDWIGANNVILNSGLDILCHDRKIFPLLQAVGVPMSIITRSYVPLIVRVVQPLNLDKELVSQFRCGLRVQATGTAGSVADFQAAASSTDCDGIQKKLEAAIDRQQRMAVGVVGSSFFRSEMDLCDLSFSSCHCADYRAESGRSIE